MGGFPGARPGCSLVLRQVQDVLTALRSGGSASCSTLMRVEQILAETALGGQAVQGCGGWRRSGARSPCVSGPNRYGGSPLLDKAQQQAWASVGSSPISSRTAVPAVGGFDQAHAAGVGAGESALSHSRTTLIRSGCRGWPRNSPKSASCPRARCGGGRCGRQSPCPVPVSPAPVPWNRWARPCGYARTASASPGNCPECRSSCRNARLPGALGLGPRRAGWSAIMRCTAAIMSP